MVTREPPSLENSNFYALEAWRTIIMLQSSRHFIDNFVMESATVGKERSFQCKAGLWKVTALNYPLIIFI